MRKSTTKRALVTSVMALFLCFTMLLACADQPNDNEEKDPTDDPVEDEQPEEQTKKDLLLGLPEMSFGGAEFNIMRNHNDGYSLGFQFF